MPTTESMEIPPALAESLFAWMAESPESRLAPPPFDAVVLHASKITGASYCFITSVEDAGEVTEKPPIVQSERGLVIELQHESNIVRGDVVPKTLSRITLESGGHLIVEDGMRDSKLKVLETSSSSLQNCWCIALESKQSVRYILGVVGMTECAPNAASTKLEKVVNGLAALVNLIGERGKNETGRRMLDYAKRRFEIFEKDCPFVVIRADLSGYITGFNESAERALGYRREEVIGKSIWMIYSELPDPDVLRRVNQFETMEFPTKTRRKDGKVIEHFLRLVPLPNTEGEYNEILGLWHYAPHPQDEHRSVSIRKRQFERNESAIQDELDHMDMGVVIVGNDNRIRFMNKYMHRLLDTTPDKSAGVEWHEVLKAVGDGQRQLSELLAGEVDKLRGIRIELATKHGAQRTMNITAGTLRQESGTQLIYAYDETKLEGLRSGIGETSGDGICLTRDPGMLSVLERVRTLASVDVTTLIEGETGTGKELIARILHDESVRSSSPFVAINCANLSTNFGPSQLFGHRKGAFTGAIEHRAGAFAEGDGGTIFLDEVAEIPLEFQAALLRVLQEKEVVPLGEVRPKSIDVRVVAATNRKLAALVEEGTFREDLYYRLNVARVELPPLRDRQGDIAMLAEYFLNQFDTTHKRPSTQIGRSAMDVLFSYHWPGNIRQLKHVVESAAIDCGGNYIFPEHLSIGFKHAAKVGTGHFQESQRHHESPLAQQIDEALKQTGGNKSAAAKLLGIGRATLYRHLDQEKDK